MSSRLPCLATLIVLVLLAGCEPVPSTDVYHQIDGRIFATNYHVTYLGETDKQTIKNAIEQELQRIDRMASNWRSDSELTHYNHAQNRKTFTLSCELAELIQHSHEIEEMTQGAFDIRFDGDHFDLSGIAKGYAVERVSTLLRDQYGIESFLVDIGGEIHVRGNGPEGNFWNVGIYTPGLTDSPVDSRTLQLRDTSIATSGTYFKGGHIIDPRTGLSVGNELISASVIHPSCTMADALATALFVMGPEEGMAWAKEHKVHAIFLFKDGRVLEIGD